MIKIKNKIKNILPITEILYNKDSNLKLKSFKLHQLTQSVKLKNKASFFSEKEFHTTKIDLKRSLEDIWSNFDKKSVKYEINKAEKEKENISVKKSSDYNLLYNIAKEYYLKKYSTNPDLKKELKHYVSHCDLLVAYHNKKPVATILLIKDFPERVRLLKAYSRYLENAELKKISGYLNKYLHWKAIQIYKEEGYSQYDLGGVNLDKDHETYGITKFKLGFGGELITEYNYWTTKSYWFNKILKFFLGKK